MSATDALLARLAAHGCGTKETSKGWQARCPAHEDDNPSLSISRGEKGAVLTCRAGCPTSAVVAALGIRMADLFDEPKAASHPGAPGRPSRREWHVRDAGGAIVATHVRIDSPNGKKQYRWRRGDVWSLGGLASEDLPLYRCETVAGTSGAILVTEGEKSADAAARRCVVVVGTVTGANACPGAAALSVLAGRDVILWPDNDPIGRAHMAAVAASLRDVAGSIRCVDWQEAPPKGDAFDFTGSDEAFRALVDGAKPWAFGPETVLPAGIKRQDSPAGDAQGSAAVDADGRPIIRSGVRLDLTTDEAERALATLKAPRVFTRARGLVVIRREGGKKLRGVRRDPGAPFAHELAAESIRELLSKGAGWRTFDKRTEEWAPCLPPGPVVAALHKRGAWEGIPPLHGIVEAPTMRPDGTILSQPGYDDATGLLYDPRGLVYPEVPSDPSADDVKRAVAALRDPFEQFEWSKPDADLPVVLALMLTLAARPMFEGTSPCFAFDSTTRGSGKGLACESAAIAATGRRYPVSVLSPEPEEQRKALFTLALEGHRVVLLDNITRPLGGPVLSAVLTAGEIRDRVLGGSRSASAPFDAVLVATGNALRYVGDFDRRVLVARQVPSVENPEDRQPPGGYRYPELRKHVMDEHPRLLAAALTVLRAFHVAGRPIHGQKSMGSFESWDGVVRGACLWASIGDPLACRESIRADADEDRERIAALLACWHEAFGSTSATVAEAVERAKIVPGFKLALAAFDTKGDPEHPNVISIGRGVRAILGRIVGGLRLERYGKGSPISYRACGVVGIGGIDTASPNTPHPHARARVGGPAGENPTNPTTPAETREPAASDEAAPDWWARQGLDDRGAS